MRRGTIVQTPEGVGIVVASKGASVQVRFYRPVTATFHDSLLETLRAFPKFEGKSVFHAGDVVMVANHLSGVQNGVILQVYGGETYRIRLLQGYAYHSATDNHNVEGKNLSLIKRYKNGEVK